MTTPDNYIVGHMDKQTDDKQAYNTHKDENPKSDFQWHPAFYAGIQIEFEEEADKLIFENEEVGVRYFWVKPSDVAIYVERGAADIGVAGKDILLEYAPDVYELLDLDMGKCRMCVAGKKEFTDNGTSTLRVATKFANITKNYYASMGRDIDIIHLNGSIEIAPILKLSDVIVDIVETFMEMYDRFAEAGDLEFLQDAYNAILVNKNREVCILEPEITMMLRLNCIRISVCSPVKKNSVRMLLRYLICFPDIQNHCIGINYLLRRFGFVKNSLN